MIDYFIKADTEETFWNALIAHAVVQEATYTVGDSTVTQKITLGGNSLDVIGIIFKPTGNMLTEGIFTIPEQLPIPGYHANLRGYLSEEQITGLGELLIAAPSSPARVWA